MNGSPQRCEAANRRRRRPRSPEMRPSGSDDAMTRMLLIDQAPPPDEARRRQEASSGGHRCSHEQVHPRGGCRARIDAQRSTYTALAAAAKAQSGSKRSHLESALVRSNGSASTTRAGQPSESDQPGDARELGVGRCSIQELRFDLREERLVKTSPRIASSNSRNAPSIVTVALSVTRTVVAVSGCCSPSPGVTPGVAFRA